MPQLILHKDGAYNIYTTVADGACYEHALTREQLEEVIRFEGGARAVAELPWRLERAHKTGCSAISGETLEECIAGNRAGENEANLSLEEFVERFLTLPQNTTDDRL
jgi:hypothetical protein